MSAAGRASAPAARPALGAWLGFAPLAAVVGLRWVLAWLHERAGAPPAWPLQPFAGAQDPLDWLPGAGAALLALALLAVAAWGVRRRAGARALWRLLAALWLLAAALACAAQLAHYLNLRGLAPQAAPLAARVLGSRAVPPSARGPGGTLVVLQLPGQGPQQALIDDPAAAHWRAGQPLALRWAAGRWWGRYVTGWQLPAQGGAAPGLR